MREQIGNVAGVPLLTVKVASPVRVVAPKVTPAVPLVGRERLTVGLRGLVARGAR